MRGFGAAEEAVVCPRCYTPRQPQDFVRALPDNQSVPVSRTRSIPLEGVWINNDSLVVPWANNTGMIIPWLV